MKEFEKLNRIGEGTYGIVCEWPAREAWGWREVSTAAHSRAEACASDCLSERQSVWWPMGNLAWPQLLERPSAAPRNAAELRPRAAPAAQRVESAHVSSVLWGAIFAQNISFPP